MMNIPSSLKPGSSSPVVSLEMDGDASVDYPSFHSNASSDGFAVGEGVENPGEHDLLLGRGGETNSHSGNAKFRKLIEQYKPMYVAAPRRDKPEIARLLVAHWKGLNPPGRFLAKRAAASGYTEAAKKLWYEISDEAAKKRASKSLGEKQKSGSPTKESVSSDTAKRTPKNRLRSLEAKAARKERGSHRNDRFDISFPVAQTQSESGSQQSFLYDPLEMPQLEKVGPAGTWTSAVDSLSSSFNSGNFGNTINPSPLPTLQVSDGIAQVLAPSHFAVAPSGTGDVVCPTNVLGLQMTPSSTSAAVIRGNTRNGGFFPSSNRHHQSLATPLDNTDGDVPTAAELTACWDD